MVSYEEQKEEVLRIQKKLDNAVKKANSDLDSSQDIKIPHCVDKSRTQSINKIVHHRMNEVANGYHNIELVKEALLKTNEPKYVQLGRYLEKILVYTPKTTNDDYEKAMDLVEGRTPTGEFKEFSTKKDIKTIYKEFKKKDKARKIMTKKRTQLISKYKEVEKFIHHTVDKIAEDLEGFDPKTNYYGKDDRFTPEGLIEYFDSIHALEFLDYSDLTVGVRKR